MQDGEQDDAGGDAKSRAITSPCHVVRHAQSLFIAAGAMIISVRYQCVRPGLKGLEQQVPRVQLVQRSARSFAGGHEWIPARPGGACSASAMMQWAEWEAQNTRCVMDTATRPLIGRTDRISIRTGLRQPSVSPTGTCPCARRYRRRRGVWLVAHAWSGMPAAMRATLPRVEGGGRQGVGCQSRLGFWSTWTSRAR